METEIYEFILAGLRKQPVFQGRRDASVLFDALWQTYLTPIVASQGLTHAQAVGVAHEIATQFQDEYRGGHEDPRKLLNHLCQRWQAAVRKMVPDAGTTEPCEPLSAEERQILEDLWGEEDEVDHSQ